MKLKLLCHLSVGLAVLLLPAVMRATPPPKFQGEPENFVGLYSNGRAYLSVTLGHAGKFTGILDFAAGAHDVIKGTVDSTGFFSGTTGAEKTPYTVQITGSTPDTYSLVGMSEGREITAYPAAYSKGETAEEIGKYTTVFPVDDMSAIIPQGTGYATVSVSKSGAATVTGKLADGTTFSSSSVIVEGTNGHELIVYDRNLYKKKGFISGVFNFNELVAYSSEKAEPSIEGGRLNGTFLWEKPATTGHYYPSEFSIMLDGSGTLYSKAEGVAITSGTLTVTGTGSPVMQPFTVTSHGVVTFTPPNTSDARLSIKVANGSVTGSIKDNGAEVKLKGVLVQQGEFSYAEGYFLTPVVSGTGFSGSFSLP